MRQRRFFSILRTGIAWCQQNLGTISENKILIHSKIAKKVFFHCERSQIMTIAKITKQSFQDIYFIDKI